MNENWERLWGGVCIQTKAGADMEQGGLQAQWCSWQWATQITVQVQTKQTAHSLNCPTEWFTVIVCITTLHSLETRQTQVDVSAFWFCVSMQEPAAGRVEGQMSVFSCSRRWTHEWSWLWTLLFKWTNSVERFYTILTLKCCPYGTAFLLLNIFYILRASIPCCRRPFRCCCSEIFQSEAVWKRTGRRPPGMSSCCWRGSWIQLRIIFFRSSQK